MNRSLTSRGDQRFTGKVVHVGAELPPCVTTGAVVVSPLLLIFFLRLPLGGFARHQKGAVQRGIRVTGHKTNENYVLRDRYCLVIDCAIM